MKITYGKIIPNLKINNQEVSYPVVNEREIRASAGITFFIGIITLLHTYYTKDLNLVKIILPIFWLDFFLKTIIAPQFSIFGNIAKLFVSNQKPEYVGAIQKRFAWSIGLLLASSMIVILFALNLRGIFPLSICSICLFFMWMESSLGICVGCKLYYGLINLKVIKKPEYQPACPGGVCSIQK
jgi:hypothetical protein